MGAVINTFDKGLHQDSTFILQPDNTYRNLKNGSLISHDGNHYVIELSKGNKVAFTLPKRYNGATNVYDLAPMPIAFISYLDKLAVLFTNDETLGGGYGEIGLVSFTRIGEDFISTYTPYYHHSDLNFSLRHKIEGFSFEETDIIKRIYWSDDNEEPRAFDFANPIFTDYKAVFPATPLVIGTQYMVLQGAVTHNAVAYGQGLPFGNIFTAAATSYTLLAGTPLVIEYYPLSLLDWTPSRLLGTMAFKEYGIGSKYCGSNIYFYRLVSSFDGVATTWSYASSPIHVGMDNEAVFLGANAYRNFVGNGSLSTLEDSGKSVIITITGIDQDFDQIEVAVAEFTQKSDVPYIIKTIAKSDITGASMDITDTGTTNFGTVAISGLTLFPANILKCKTLTTNKNYIIIGNTTERDEFELDLSGVTTSNVNYPMICHGDYKNSCINGNIYNDVSPTAAELTTNPAIGAIKPRSRYLVSVAPNATNRVEYPVASGTYYYTGDVFVGVAGSVTATFTGTAQARPCTTRNRYTKINASAFSGNRVEDAILLKTAFWDYKDPAVASHNKGYWSNERYRLAFVGFDLKGNPFYAKHISDVDMDTIYAKGGLIRQDTYSGGISYSLNPSGINISGLDIPESVMNQLSGFSIMRAERDVRIVTQGLINQNSVVSPGGGATDFITPLGTISPGLTAAGTAISPTFFSFLCPDNNVNDIPFIPLDAVGNSMEEACFINQDHGIKTETTSIKNVFVKLFGTQVIDAQFPRKWTLASINGLGMRRYNESALDPLFDGAFDYKNYICGVDGLSLNASIVDACAAGAFGANEVQTVGCRKLVIKPATQINYYNSYVINYGSIAAGGVKLLANVTTGKDKTSQYGGSSDAAIASTLYMSTGHFQPINAQVKTDTEAIKLELNTIVGVISIGDSISGATSLAIGMVVYITGTTIYLGSVTGTFIDGEVINDTTSAATAVLTSGSTTYLFMNIEVFGGDCFTSMIDQLLSLYSDTYFFSSESMSFGIFYPCEGNVNYNLRRGRKLSIVGAAPGSAGESIKWEVPTRLEDYSYNLGYNTNGTFVKYPALPLNFKFTGRFPYRARFAGFKYPGELFDSFRKFLVNDYKDMDGKLGEINNVRSKAGKTAVWQNHGVSSVPILERQLISGNNGANTTIGTGGVIDRFDPISSTYGNQHQHGLTETEYGYIWFDMRNRALCIMGADSGIQEISLAKGLQAFFNNEFNEGDINGLSDYSIYNTNDSEIEEVPLLGYGIVGVYDPKFKMSYLTFKYREDTLVDELDQLVTLLAKDFTIGYSHVLNAIIGFYDFCPAIWHNHNDLVLSSNNSKNRVYYGAAMDSTDFVVGNTISVNDNVTDRTLNGEYVCIQNLTVAAYPATGIYEPTYTGSVYWIKTNDQSQVYLQTFNTQYLKFYGQVYSSELEIIVNPRVDNPFTSQNMQTKAVGDNWTSVTASTDDQTASDLNISSTNRNYRYVDKAWFSNLPLPPNGRLTDYYLKLNFIYKGYVTNPTVSKNTQRVVQWLKTFFVIKK